MSKIEDVSEAIADETKIAAIEEAGIITQSQSAEDDDNPADRRLPLIHASTASSCWSKAW